LDLSRYVRPLRPPRARRRPRVAFVLSGGGVLGAVHVGQLYALIEAGIIPDVVVGTSVGALNAAAVAADPSRKGLDLLRDAWLDLKGEDLFPGSRMQRAWHFVARGDHLYPNDGIRALVDKLPVQTFEELIRPLSVVAANLRTGREHYFESGALAPALLASTALPSIFPPVLVGGELYVDGGVVNNVPISRAVALGARQIYVLTCAGPIPRPREIRRPLDVLLQAFAHSRAARIERDLELYGSAASILVLDAPAPTSVRFNDMSHTARLIEKGYEAARAQLVPSDVAAL